MPPNPHSPPIPRRTPPLTWRRPALLWTPVALALALGWPALAFSASRPLMLAVTIGGALAVAFGLSSLGVAWALGRAPRTRRNVIVHFVSAGALVALAAPFVIEALLAAAAGVEREVTGLRPASAFALLPFAALIGLPTAYFFGICFGFVALSRHETRAPRPPRDKRTPEERMHEAQPFV